MRPVSMIVMLALAFVLLLATTGYIMADFSQRYHLNNTINVEKYATYREINELQGTLQSSFQKVTNSDANISVTSGDVWSLNWLEGLKVSLLLLGKAPNIANAMISDLFHMTGLPATTLLIGILGAVVIFLLIRKAVERVIGKV